ncbi:Pentatricopeptide repeat-containing protein [Glycine soja]|uniref:Pentatricopeptide repeat-containing protein n=1 Tax=Glycine soja TaxID=3848 RepID=A0A445FT26_GLYSO|nr:Pentatricopeptide repeat-containing protein [Glycine soja]
MRTLGSSPASLAQSSWSLLSNALGGAYAKLDMLEKAEELKEHARRRGAKPNGKTLEIFMDSYLQKGNFKSTVDCLDEAISMGRWNGEKWVPSSKIIDIMMRNFEQEKDVDGAEEFLEILKKSMESPGVEVFESLTRTYAATGRISSAMLRRLKMENVQVSEGTQKLLEAISEE